MPSNAQPQEGHSAQGGGRALLAQLAHGLPLLLLLTMITVVAHVCHLLDFVETRIVRYVGEQQLKQLNRAEEQMQALADDALPGLGANGRILLLEVSPLLRIQALEQDSAAVAPATVDRTGGVRPIDRVRMSALLESLAQHLAQARQAPRGPERRVRPLVLIDVDVTPNTTEDIEPMKRALDALRRQADVVAIVFARPLDKKGENYEKDKECASGRCLRNDFMVQHAECTTASRLAAEDPARGRLLFASPRFFHQRYGFPYDFPFELKPHRDWRPAQVSEDLPTRFPSLGNLANALASGSSEASLTWLCEQAGRHLKDAALLEDDLEACGGGDEPAAKRCQEVVDRYAHRRFNFGIQSSAVIDRFVLMGQPAGNGVAGIQQAMAGLDPERLDVDLVMVAVDGGVAYDRYDVVSLQGQRMSGGPLHLLQALSAGPPHELHERPWLSVLIDVGIGLCFLLLHATLLMAASRLPQAWQSPAVGRVGRFLLPAALAALCGYVCLDLFAPWLLLQVSVWVNPAYVLLGLMAHAYVEVGQGGGSEEEPHLHWPDFSFGLRAVRRHKLGMGDWIVGLGAMALLSAGIVAYAMDAHAHLLDSVLVGVAVAGLVLSSFLTLPPDPHSMETPHAG